MRHLLPFLLFVGPLAAAIIDPTRLPPAGDWSGAGVDGGIPARTQTVFASVTDSPYNATGDGVTNDYAAVAAAVAACPVGQVLYFPAGTYLMGNNQLVISKGIILRGAGPGVTTIESSYSNYEGAISFWGTGITGSYADGYYDGVRTNITAGATRGSTTITVASTANITVGHWIMIVGENADVMNTNNDENNGDSWNPAAGFFAKIESIDGSDVTLSEPLPWTYDVKEAYAANALVDTGNPEANVLYKAASQNLVEGAGLEDMTIDGTGGITGVGFILAANCWMDNCEVYDWNTRNVYINASTRITIHGSLIRDTRGNGSGGGYGVLMETKSSHCLIENNRFNMNASAVLVDDGASLNVVAYNYVNDFKYFQANWQVVQFSHHRSHPQFNLFEGNWGPNMMGDNIHGSASHATVFRNRLHGKQDATRTNHLWVVSADRNNTYYNFVGNILGTAGTHDVYKQDYTQGSSILYATESIYTLGFVNYHIADYTYGDPAPSDTAYIHGDYDVVTDGITWDAGNADHTIPNSMYLTSKPDWFGTLTWPPYDPASPSNSEATRIPAGYLYLNGVDPPSASQVRRSPSRAARTGALPFLP